MAVRFALRSGLSQVAICLAAASILLLAGGFASPPPGTRDPVGKEVRDRLASSGTARVIVFLDLPAVPASERARVKLEVARVQEKVLGALGTKDFQVSHRFLTVPALAGEMTSAGLEKLAVLPEVIRVDLDAPVQADLAQSVPLIRADEMQALGYDGTGVTAAILDTGADTDHPDLVDDIVAQECFCTGGCCPNAGSRQSGAGAAEDNNGHGSNVAGIVTSKGVVSSVGVAPNAKIVVIKVLDGGGSGDISDTVAALDWIAANRPDVKVINMSLGAGLFVGDCDNATSWTLALSSAINGLRTNGTLSFASAGNDGSGTRMGAPACIANAISVGAVYDANVGSVSFGAPANCTDSTTQADQVTCFSDSNSTTDVFAPGGAIRSDYLGGVTAVYYGTSQASPHAVGCAADLLTAAPSLTPDEIEATLEASGVPVTDPKNGLTFPRIDCLGALENLGACIDRDQDGYGQPGSDQCPNGAAVDCDDTNASVYPGAPEICDGVNDDCSSPTWPTVPAGEVDSDGDNSPLCADCDDTNAAVYPGAPQICDGINNDCDAAGWPAVPADEVDGDGDTYLACNDCDDTNAAVYSGAPQICDGINNDCSAFGWPSLVGTNENDDDADGLSECQGDCDDVHPSVYPGAPQICDGLNNDCLAAGWPSLAGTNEADDDGDSLTACQGDCDDTHAAVYPGAPQICDGLNNDCLAAGWPSLAGTNDGDDDGDSLTECQGDCDDADTNTYLGAVETNDGRDNQCAGEPGYGITDEISGPLAFTNPGDPDEISWPDQPGATLYEVVRADSPAFPPACGDQVTALPSWSDTSQPALNETFFYLARAIAPNVGSWGEGWSQERVGLCGAESVCDDSVDNDSDGLTDCSDPDCFQDPACAPATFTFVDTEGDDIAPAALTDFFDSITAAPTDYIFFSISGPDTTDYSFCSERADFYRDSYLSLAVTGGTAMSGSWNRWTLLQGGSWTGPDTTGYPNSYSGDCLETHAWCAEFGLAGRYPAVLPEQTALCEAADFGLGCGTGAWVLTLKVGHQRLATCGF